MRQRWDKSIQSSNTPTFNNPGMSRDDYNLYRCMVTKVIYADDKENVTKNAPNPEVIYEVIILGGFQTGQILSNVRMASWLGGGINSYGERTLKATTKNISKDTLSKHDGDIVYVQFLQGHSGYPIIIALGKGISNKIAAKKSDGPRSLDEFNGLIQEINNKGEFKFTMKNGETKDGVFTEGKESVINEFWSKDEKIIRTFKSGLVITEDGKSDKVNIKMKSGVEATIDGAGKKFTFKAASTEGNIDGSGNKITLKAGSTEVIIDGASGKITLKGDMVDLGKSVSDFVTLFTQLATAFNTHTHQFIDLTPVPVPSMTFPPSAPLLSTVGSQTVKVQP